MTEYIGARITLISKSDIRYSGILHEINSENSTVALENVTSFGTEGRRGDDSEVPPSDHIYEYIIFRGSDVKDLKIESQAEKPKPQAPAVPNDPAILGAARPPTQQQQQQQQQPQQQTQNQPNGPQQGQNFGPGPFPPQYPPYPPFAGRGFPPQGAFPPGPTGFGYPGYPPYGPPPPGWQGPPGQGFPPMPNQFSPPGPIGAPGQQGHPQHQHANKGPVPAGPAVGNKEEKPKVAEADGAPKVAELKPASQTSTPVPATQKKPPTPPVETKPNVAAALAPPAHPAKNVPAPQKPIPTGPKSGRIVPAIPLSSPGPKPAAQPATTNQALASVVAAAPPQNRQATANATLQYQQASEQAAAAVAAAMAKITPQQSDPAALDNLTKKVAEMRADDRIRHSRPTGPDGHAAHAGARGGGRGRGGPRHAQHHVAKVEVPTTDFDFESANAKFNKKDLVKEAIATGSPLGETPSAGANGTSTETNGDAHNEDVVIPGSDSSKPYDKTTSFFDNISSESKDRGGDTKAFGQEFRTEERKKNLETFGQGSVDGYRGGYRGRGFRGRGRGRGGFPRGRGRGQGAWAPRGGVAPADAS